MKAKGGVGKLAGRWGNQMLDAARIDQHVIRLEKRVGEVVADRNELRLEVIHLQRCWDKCAELLRNAKAANHKLLMQAHRRSQGGRGHDR